VRLANADGAFRDGALLLRIPCGRPGPRTTRVAGQRERYHRARAGSSARLEDLRTQVQTQGEILRGVLQAGGARFSAFLQRTDASMKAINGVLKKPARETPRSANKLEQTLERSIESGAMPRHSSSPDSRPRARSMEDSLQDLRSRGALSGSDFLPLAVKLDQLYGQFAQLRSLTPQRIRSQTPMPSCSPKPRDGERHVRSSKRRNSWPRWRKDPRRHPRRPKRTAWLRPAASRAR